MGAQMSLYSQITKISGMLITQGCLFKEVAQPYSAQKAGNEGEWEVNCNLSYLKGQVI